MTVWLAANYDLLRGLHILAAIAWMAGLLYLPRLFIYHCSAPPGSDRDQTFQVMEQRLLRGIMNPAMAATYLFGIGLILAGAEMRGWEFLSQPWMLAKLGGVLVLTIVHGALSKARKEFAASANRRSERFWRITNEIPALAAIIMIIAVTVEFGRP
jgi:putative membrane protein